MDVFVFPSETETVGNVVLEAMASGLPIVAMAQGGPRFVATSRGSALLARDHRQFIDAVAALVPNVQLSGGEAGSVVELEARIERFDGRAVLYSGTARSDGADLAVLSRCVGPLLPMETFDDPATVRRRFEALCSARPADVARAEPRAIPRPLLSACERDGDTARARLQIPDAAPFFSEHFPRFPVYPAVLLADAQHQIAAPLAAHLLGVAAEAVRPSAVIDFKVRAFSPPGQMLDLVATSRTVDADGAHIAIAAFADGKRVATGMLAYRPASST